MLLQPGFDGLDCAVGEQIYGLAALQVTDQRPIAESAFVRPIVQSDDARLCLGDWFGTANQTQDGITTPTDAELASHIGSCLASYSESQLTECFVAAAWCVARGNGTARGATKHSVNWDSE